VEYIEAFSGVVVDINKKQ